jgi:hypothetical protein
MKTVLSAVLFFLVLTNLKVQGQVATFRQNFGTSAATLNNTSANTSFFPSVSSGPNSGGTYSISATHSTTTVQNFGLATTSFASNPSTSSSVPRFSNFGTGSRFYMRGLGLTSNNGDNNNGDRRATKFSVYNFGGATQSFAMSVDFYIDGVNNVVNDQDGTLLLLIGNEGTNNNAFSQVVPNSGRDDFDKSGIFMGLRLRIDNGLITTYRFWNNDRGNGNGQGWSNETNFTTALSLNTKHRLVIVANNSSSTATYSLNNVSQNVASRRFDLFINDSQITNDNSTLGQLSSETNLNGFSFNLGYNDRAQNLTLLLDNLTYTVNANNAAALPVTLTSFAAKPTPDNKVSLGWVTSTEQVNKGFRIERQAGYDNGKYEQIGFVGSKAKDGNSQNTLYYSFIDAAPKAGASSFYRLVQEDLDGKLTYSEVRVVKLNGQSVSMVFPSPSNGAVNISRTADGKKMNIQVIDQSGRIVSQVNNITDANYRMNISQSGVYTIKMTYPETGEKSIQRVVVQK